MKGFKQFIIEEQLLVEGGNAKAINRKTQEVIARPQRLDMSTVSRTDIRKKLLDLFKDLNIQFGKKYEEPLWPSINVGAKFCLHAFKHVPTLHATERGTPQLPETPVCPQRHATRLERPSTNELLLCTQSEGSERRADGQCWVARSSR